MEAAPPKITQLLNDEFATLPVAQVATLSDGMPFVRSMALYGLLDGSSPLFLTHRGSAKWRQLEENASISVCLVNRGEDKQIRAQGQAELHSLNTRPKLLTECWKKVPFFARHIYYQLTPQVGANDSLPCSNEAVVPDSFGVIVVIPNSWEFLLFDGDDYTRSHRERFTRSAVGWSSELLAIY